MSHKIFSVERIFLTAFWETSEVRIVKLWPRIDHSPEAVTENSRSTLGFRIQPQETSVKTLERSVWETISGV